MKYLLIILIPLIYGCQTTTAQKVDPSIQEDREFEELLSKVETNNKFSLEVQAQATETQKKIVSHCCVGMRLIRQRSGSCCWAVVDNNARDFKANNCWQSNEA